MARYKAAMLLLLKRLIKTRGRAHELVFHRSLDPHNEACFESAAHEKWIPAEQGAEILVVAAQVLFPMDTWALRKLGRAEARDNLRGLAKRFGAKPSPADVMRALARLWRVYHDTGRAVVGETPSSGEVFLEVRGFPELPETYREIMAGFIQEAMEMVGLEGLTIMRRETDPRAWRWIARPGAPA